MHVLHKCILLRATWWNFHSICDSVPMFGDSPIDSDRPNLANFFNNNQQPFVLQLLAIGHNIVVATSYRTHVVNVLGYGPSIFDFTFHCRRPSRFAIRSAFSIAGKVATQIFCFFVVSCCHLIINFLSFLGEKEAATKRQKQLQSTQVSSGGKTEDNEWQNAVEKEVKKCRKKSCKMFREVSISAASRSGHLLAGKMIKDSRDGAWLVSLTFLKLSIVTDVNVTEYK